MALASQNQTTGTEELYGVFNELSWMPKTQTAIREELRLANLNL